MTLEAKNLDSPEDKRSFEHGELRMVQVGGTTIGRAVFNPGWRWSTDVKPLVGTQSCQVSAHRLRHLRAAARADGRRHGGRTGRGGDSPDYVSTRARRVGRGPGGTYIVIDVTPAAQPAARRRAAAQPDRGCPAQPSGSSNSRVGPATSSMT